MSRESANAVSACTLMDHDDYMIKAAACYECGFLTDEEYLQLVINELNKRIEERK